jgi:predicted ATPase
MTKPERIIITGGPGSGKSTLIEKLKALGYPCMDEAARKVISQHEGGTISPWGDMQEFVRLVYEQTFQGLQRPLSGPAFCDRSILDCIAYLKEAGMPVPDYLSEFDPHAYYRREVFILPPWQEIYRQEKARRQDYDKAVLLYKSLKNTYEDYGFLLTEIPPLTVGERIRFMFKKLNLQQQLY